MSILSKSAAYEKLLFSLCTMVIIGSALLGGGTRSGFVSDVILQFTALPLLLTALWVIFETPLTKAAKRAIWLCLAFVSLPLIQLIPLPPQIWTSLPQRAPLVASFELAGVDIPWMPASVAPRATWLALLSMLPPLAVFFGTLLLDTRRRRMVTVLILLAGIVSVFVGLMQIAQGPESSLRFFEFTNLNDAVGFFANRNHFAAFLYILTLFAAALTVDLATTSSSQMPDAKVSTGLTARLAAGFTILVILVAAQAMARSRAGLGLTIVALSGAFLLAFSTPRKTSDTSAKLLTGAIILAVILTTQFALYRILERFTPDSVGDARLSFARTTIDAARAAMPFGSGIGSFVPEYSLFEKAADAGSVYANRAHNEFLELWLENGVIGFGLLGLFLVWFVSRLRAVWRPFSWSDPSGTILARASTIIIGLLILHSFVDYPLRTGTLITVMAFACALLVEPQVSDSGRPQARDLGRSRHAGTPNPPRVNATNPAHAAVTSANASTQLGGLGHSEIDWPLQWRDPPA